MGRCIENKTNKTVIRIGSPLYCESYATLAFGELLPVCLSYKLSSPSSTL
jgi:hypothetical protein